MTERIHKSVSCETSGDLAGIETMAAAFGVSLTVTQRALLAALCTDGGAGKSMQTLSRSMYPMRAKYSDVLMRRHIANLRRALGVCGLDIERQPGDLRALVGTRVDTIIPDEIGPPRRRSMRAASAAARKGRRTRAQMQQARLAREGGS